MSLNLEGKKAIVADVLEQAKNAQSAVIADSRGVTVNDMTVLRAQARDNGVWLKVVRNTLARLAVQGTSFEGLADSFVGPTLIAFSMDHPGAGARILVDFAKTNDKLELKAAMFEGEMTPVSSRPHVAEAISTSMLPGHVVTGTVSAVEKEETLIVVLFVI